MQIFMIIDEACESLQCFAVDFDMSFQEEEEDGTNG